MCISILLFILKDVCADVGEPNGIVSISIANFDSTYRYILKDDILIEADPPCGASDSACAKRLLGQIIQSHDRAKSKEIENARAGVASLPFGTQWANVSPNKKFVMYGPDNLIIKSKGSAFVMNAKDNNILLELADEGYSIECVKWIHDSLGLAILESKSHLNKTPLGIIGAIFGHGVSVSNYILRMVWLDNSHPNANYAIPRSFDESEACLD